MWIFYAIATAICWGFIYSFAERIIPVIGKFNYLFLITASNLPIYWFLTRFELHNIGKAVEIWPLLLTVVAASIIGNIMSLQAIENSNATFVAAIEMSYPIWCYLIVLIIFKENQLTFYSSVGILFILIGTIFFCFKG